METQKGREKPPRPRESEWLLVISIAFRPLKWLTWRPQAPSGAQLGGPRRFKTPTWRSKAGLKAQLGGPKLDFRRSWVDFGIPEGRILCFFEGLSLQLAGSAENVTTYEKPRKKNNGFLQVF